MTGSACASCGATDLEPGIIIDSVQAGAGPTTWMSGIPEFGAFGRLKWRNRPLYDIDAYACRAYRYLNLFVGVRQRR